MVDEPAGAGSGMWWDTKELPKNKTKKNKFQELFQLENIKILTSNISKDR